MKKLFFLLIAATLLFNLTSFAQVDTCKCPTPVVKKHEWTKKTPAPATTPVNVEVNIEETTPAPAMTQTVTVNPGGSANSDTDWLKIIWIAIGIIALAILLHYLFSYSGRTVNNQPPASVATPATATPAPVATPIVNDWIDNTTVNLMRLGGGSFGQTIVHTNGTRERIFFNLDPAPQNVSSSSITTPAVIPAATPTAPATTTQVV